MAEFDFEYWCALAEDDPEGYFRARRQAIEALIAACPPERRERLRAMQVQIDCVRASAGCPAQAVDCLCLMLLERLSALRRHQAELGTLAQSMRNTLGGCPPDFRP